MKRLLVVAMLAACAGAPAVEDAKQTGHEAAQAGKDAAGAAKDAATAKAGEAKDAATAKAGEVKDAAAAKAGERKDKAAAAVAAGTPDADYRQQAPAPGAAVEFHAPVPKAFKLKNGLQVFLIERHDVPLVTLGLAIQAGADSDPAGKAGLASLTVDLLDEGTTTRDASAIALGFEALGARFNAESEADASALRVTALSSTLEPVLELFADVALHPAFNDKELARVRTERLGQIAQALDDPPSVGQHLLGRVIYGAQHPWGFPGEGTVKSVKAITKKDVQAWHKAWFQPRNAALFVVGDTDEATLTAALEKQLGAWKDGAAPKPVPHKAPKGQRVVWLVDKADAPQSQIWIGEVGISSAAGDVFATRVMNAVLGGTFNSRLNGNLRTEHAYSYGAFSFYDAHREPGAFEASAGVMSDKTAEALGEFLKELDKMKSGEVSDAELADAKDGQIKRIPALFASNENTARAFALAWAHGLPGDYYATYQERVQAVTKDDVAKAAREHLHPDQMAIVVVGPAKAIGEKIAAMKLGRIELRDAEGEAAKAVKAAAASGKAGK